MGVLLAYVPYSSLESVVEANKETCYLALRQTLATIRSDAARLATLAVVLSARTGRANVAAGEEDRARTDRTGRAARAVTADRRICPQTRARRVVRTEVAQSVRFAAAMGICRLNLQPTISLNLPQYP